MLYFVVFTVVFLNVSLLEVLHGVSKNIPDIFDCNYNIIGL